MNVISRPLSALLICAFLILGGPAMAVVYVDSNAPGPAHNGNSWDTAYLTIQKGVNDSRAPGEGVWVAAGDYTENVNITEEYVSVFGGFNPDPADPDPFANRVPGTSTVTPNNAATSIFRTATGTTLDGFTIRDGKAGLGAAIKSNGATLIVQNCTILDNMSRNGAGIYAETGYVSVRLCSFDNNTARDTATYPGIAEGGAIWVGAATLAVSDCSFLNQFASASKELDTGPTARGGAIFAQGGSAIRVDRCLFADCSATGSILTTYYAYGGAIFSEGNTVYLASNFFVRCLALGAGDSQTSYGGALALIDTSNVNIRNNTFAQCAVTPNAGTPTDSDRPYGFGSAIYMTGGKPASILNNIIAKNRGTAVYNSGMQVNFNYNLVWHNAGGDIYGFAFPTTNPSKGIVDANIMKDPQFRLLDINDYHITLGSPAINAGSTQGAPSLDIDSENRLPSLDKYVDIGADEFIDSNGDGGADTDPRTPKADTDGDGVVNPFDNSPGKPNPDQADSNGDGLGDVSTNNVVFHVDGSKAQSGNGLSWANAFKTIQEGIDAADMHNADGWTQNPEVWVRGVDDTGAQIIYTENLLLWHGVRVYGGWAGTEKPNQADVRSNRLLAPPPDGNQTIVDGGGIDTVIVIAHLPQDRYITDAAIKQAYDLAQPVFDGFTITNGLGELGGGVSIYKSTANVSACRIEENTAALGGGLYAYKSVGIVGDGIGPLPGNILNGDTTISDNNATGAESYAGIGGGVYVERGSFSIFANIIAGNRAYYGGGIAALNSSPIITMNQIGCKSNRNTAAGNSLTDGQGGGVYLWFSDAVLDKDTIVWNQALGATGQGGGIWAETSDFVLKSSIVAHNIAADGGAIWANNSWPMITYTCFFKNGTAAYTGIDDLFGEDSTNILTDPMFMDPANCDYRLLLNSPCIEAGDPAENPTACPPNMGAFQDVDPIVSVGEAKDLENGVTVELQGVIVTAVFSDSIYVEQSDRSAGIKVRVSNAGVSEGQMVDVNGVMATIDGEKQVMNARVHQTISPASELGPLGISAKMLGTGLGASGLTSVGLLVKTWGIVKEIDDGPDRVVVIGDGPGCTVNVHVPDGAEIPEVGQMMVVTGVSSVDTDLDGTRVRAVRARRGTDINCPQR